MKTYTKSFSDGQMPLVYVLSIIEDMMMLMVREDLAHYIEEAVAEGSRHLKGMKFTSEELLWRMPKYDDFHEPRYLAWAVMPKPMRESTPCRGKFKNENIVGSAICVLISEITDKLNNLCDEVLGDVPRGHMCQGFQIESRPLEQGDAQLFSIGGWIWEGASNWFSRGEMKYVEGYTDRAEKVARRLLPSISKVANICSIKVGGENGFVCEIGRFGAGLLFDFPKIVSINMDDYGEHIVGLAGLAVAMTAYYNCWKD